MSDVRLRYEVLRAADALADELERSTGVSDPDVQALVATYRAACDAAPADEIDRLRARVAELEAAGIDARTDHRVIATDSAGMRAESEWKRDRDLVESWASLWESEGWTVHSIESRTVSTTTRTTDWKADEQ